MLGVCRVFAERVFAEMTDVVNLFNFPQKIGQPLVMKGKSGDVYGRIVGLEGTDLEGQRPIVIFGTPHGTEVRTGIVGMALWSNGYFEVPDAEGMIKLAEFERDALSKGKWYNDKLPRPSAKNSC